MKIIDLNYLENVSKTDSICGGASTNTQAYTANNVAYADAFAASQGRSTLTRTKAYATVRNYGLVTVSYSQAYALAISRTGNTVDASASADASATISRNS